MALIIVLCCIELKQLIYWNLGLIYSLENGRYNVYYLLKQILKKSSRIKKKTAVWVLTNVGTSILIYNIIDIYTLNILSGYCKLRPV